MNQFPDNVTDLGSHPLIADRMARIRNENATTEEFRQGVHDLSQLMAFEVTRDFSTETTAVVTPLESMTTPVLARPSVLVPILRAGLGMLNGFLQVLREARVGHIGLFRNEETLRPESYYQKLPENLGECEVILLDPMLATGHSGAEAAKQIRAAGAQHLRFACLVAAPEGIEHFSAAHPDVPLFAATVDRGLNEVGYIVPGLGDAGDRYFGTL
ncbi:MAG: uracil phosphoribosyltransferase [Verrucomicrobiota bacterium]